MKELSTGTNGERRRGKEGCGSREGGEMKRTGYLTLSNVLGTSAFINPLLAVDCSIGVRGNMNVFGYGVLAN